MQSQYELTEVPHGVPIKSWTRGVMFEDEARRQVINAARLPIIHQWIAIMPDVHSGIGATIGSVIPTLKAVIPAAVGVDIGCGMMAVKTSLAAGDLPTDLREMRGNIEKAVPHGRSVGRGQRDVGSWHNPPAAQLAAWSDMQAGFERICAKVPAVRQSNHVTHLGTLGTGNHFIEVCLDENGAVWVMLHSGSRGVGNKIGNVFIELAREDMRAHLANLPDQDLAYFSEGTEHFSDYIEAVSWAQGYAMRNRQLMMGQILQAMRTTRGIPSFQHHLEAVNCHHNYVSRELHYGAEVYVTRKGAVSARKGEMGIIPGSMGARSYIVRGKGNAESFHSCSHGAGRVMSRTRAKKEISLQDHLQATTGVECRRDRDVIDESPAAYKSIDAVMAAQEDLVETVAVLKQVLCVKG